jgi:hypothetical protein
VQDALGEMEPKAMVATRGMSDASGDSYGSPHGLQMPSEEEYMAEVEEVERMAEGASPITARAADGAVAMFTGAPSAEEFRALVEMAKMLVASGFMPAHIKTASQAVAIILTGRELGMAPMRAIRSLAMVKGKVTENADSQLARFKAAGGRSKWLELDARVGKLWLRHPNGDEHTETFTFEDAERAGLTAPMPSGEKSNYHKHPVAMMRSRAITAGLKSLGWEGAVGTYDPSELVGIEAASEELLTGDALAAPAAESAGAAVDDVPPPSCPKCGGPMWDNRARKTNPKAPDYKCRDRGCDGLYWPGQWPKKVKPSKNPEKTVLPIPGAQDKGSPLGDIPTERLEKYAKSCQRVIDERIARGSDTKNVEQLLLDIDAVLEKRRDAEDVAAALAGDADGDGFNEWGEDDEGPYLNHDVEEGYR